MGKIVTNLLLTIETYWVLLVTQPSKSLWNRHSAWAMKWNKKKSLFGMKKIE